MPAVEQVIAPRQVGPLSHPDDLAPFKLSLKIPTFMNRKARSLNNGSRQPERTVPGLELDISARFAASIRNLYQLKLRGKAPMEPIEQKCLAASIVNYREILAAIFLTASKPDKDDPSSTVTLSIRFPDGSR